MMIKTRILPAAIVLVLVGLGYWFWYFTTTAPVKIEVRDDSEIKTELVATTSADNHRKVRRLPLKTRMKPGQYSLSAWGNGAAPVSITITVEKGRANVTSLSFHTATGEDYLKLYNDEGPALVALFPKETVDYLITAVIDKEAVTSLTIYAKHRFTSPTDGKLYTDERDIAVAAAKKWLKENNVPETIPIEVKDQ